MNKHENRPAGEKRRTKSDKARHDADKAINITYEGRRCIRATECVNGLPAVFDAERRPWILPTGASPDAIAAVIAKCPTGALHFTRIDGGALETAPERTTIVPTPGGPCTYAGACDCSQPTAV